MTAMSEPQRTAAGGGVPSSSPGIHADGFPNYVEAQLRDLKNRLLSEYRRYSHRQEAKAKSLEDTNLKLRRQVSRMEAGGDPELQRCRTPVVGLGEKDARGASPDPPDLRSFNRPPSEPLCGRHTKRSDTTKSKVSNFGNIFPSETTPAENGIADSCCIVAAVIDGEEQADVSNTRVWTTETLNAKRPPSPKPEELAQEGNVEDKQSSSSSSDSSTDNEEPGPDDIVGKNTTAASHMTAGRRNESFSTSFQVLSAWIMTEDDEIVGRGSHESLGMFRKCTTHMFDDDDEEDDERSWFEELVERCILQPSSRIYLCWEVIGLLLVIRDIIVIPLTILDPLHSWFMTSGNWLARLFWTADIGMSFLTGFVSSQGVTEVRPRRVAKEYARTRLPFDLFIVICDWLEVMVEAAASWNFLSMLRAMRLARLARLIKNHKRILEFMIRSEFMMLVASVQAYLVLLLALIHVIACVWYSIQADLSEELAFTDRAPLLGDLAQRYLFCFHFVLALFLGEHVVAPQNPIERAFTVVVLFFAFVVSAAFVGSLTTAMTRLQIIASQRSAQFAALSNFLSDYGISRELALRVQRNARHVLDEQKRNTPESSVALLAVISDQLRAEIHYEVHAKDLVVHPFFKLYNEANPMCMRLICHNAISLLSLSRGDVMFAESEVPSTPHMFFVTTGKLGYAQSWRSPTVQVEVNPKSWLAEALLWTTWVHRGTCQAVTECRILGVHAQRFAEIVTMYRSPQRYAYKYAGRYVQAQNEKLDIELTDLGEERETNSLAHMVFDADISPAQSRRSSRRVSLPGIDSWGQGRSGAIESVMSSFKRRSSTVQSFRTTERE